MKRRPRRGRAGAGAVAALGLAIAALAALPFFLVAVPPLSQHYDNLARMAILADPGAPFIRQFFVVRWSLIPDLAMDLAVPRLVPPLSVEVAAKLFILAALLLMFSGTVALHRAIHRAWSPWPLLSGLFLYSWVLVLGWANELFATGLMLWGLALWVALAERPAALRAAAGAAFALAIYLSHLFPLGVFAIAIAALEFAAWRAGMRDWRSLALRAATAAAPFILPAALLLASSTAGHAGETQYWWSRKLVHLVPLLMIGNPVTDWLLIASLALCGVLALWRRWLFVPPPWRLVLAALGLAYLLIPWRILGSYSAELRLAFTALFIAVAATRLARREADLQAGAALLLALVFLVRIGGVVQDWRAGARTIEAWRAGFALLKPGAVLFAYAADNRNPYPYQRPSYWNPPLTKAVSLATLAHPILVPKTYLVRGHQPVYYAPAVAPLHRLQQAQPETVASRGDFLAWLARLERQCPALPSLVTAIDVAIRDAEGRLLPPPPGARLVYRAAGLSLIEIDDWAKGSPGAGCDAAGARE